MKFNSHQFILNMVVACSPSGNMASYPQVANHRVSGFLGGHLDSVVLVLKLLSFQGAAQELCPPLCFKAKVLIHHPRPWRRASIGGEPKQLKPKIVIFKPADDIVSTSLTVKDGDD